MDAVIVSGARTPIGKFGGAFKNFSAAQLAGVAIKAALERAGISGSDVDEVILSQSYQVNENGYCGRIAEREAGIPDEVPALMVQRHCAGGLQAIVLGCRAIEVGDAEIIIAGGTDNMSQAPYLLRGAVRWGGYHLGNTTLEDNLFTQLHCGVSGLHMGATADNVAKKFGISRQEMDELALMSHQRAVAAIHEGRFKEEIAPVAVPQTRGEPITVDTDEGPRADTSLERLAKLSPAFTRDGATTAGNASQISDAAAAVVIMSTRKAAEMGITPRLRMVARVAVGVDPALMGIAPTVAVPKVLQKANMTLEQIDLIELNEAFAAPTLYCIRELGLDMNKTNVNGSGISLGHPLGFSGARMVVHLMHELPRRQARYAIATMCVGGGQGEAAILESLA